MCQAAHKHWIWQKLSDLKDSRERPGRLIRYSHNLVTWGLGGFIHPSRKNALMGSARYDVGILLAIMAITCSPFVGRLNIDDFTLFLVQNSQTGGSKLPLAPGASMDDGQMDDDILKKMSRRDVLKAFGMLKAEGRHVFHPRVDYHRFSTLLSRPNTSTAINIDGENIG